MINNSNQKMISINLKNKTNLFVRVLPSTEFDWDSIKFDDCKKCIYIRHLQEFHSLLSLKKLPKYFCYKTDGIFLNFSQSEVYETVVDQLIDQIYLGTDTVILSYGQNYSGKTFTTTGLHNQFELRGIVPRFVTDLFTEKLNRQKDFTTQIWMSIVDIKNRFSYDLLDNKKKLSKVPKEVKSVKLKSEFHSLELLFKAEAQRTTIDGKSYNAHSGTNVITFTMKVTPINSQISNKKISRVHFVDFSGVETIQRNPLTSFKDKEVQGPANVSKTLLEIFASLKSQKYKSLKSNQFSSNQSINILTQYLDKSLSTTSSVKLICHIRPNHEDLMITLSLLKFGKIFQGMPKVEPKEYIEINRERTIEGLQDQLKSLKDELLTKDLWVERSPMKITQGRLDFVKRRVELYMNSDLNELELISSVNDCNLILNIMKTMFRAKAHINVTSTSLQTDDDLEFMTRGKNYGDEVESHTKESSIKNSSVKAKTGSVFSLKHVSFKKPIEINKTESDKKGKQVDEKRKTGDKLGLLSKEVQVNLIEPNSILPSVESREAAWAMFIISRPDLEIKMHELNSLVTDKESKLKKESLTVDDIRNSLNQIEQALHQLSTMRVFVDQEGCDSETRMSIINDEEIKLVKMLKSLKNESAIHQQKLIEAQTNWLEALEKLRDEKQTIDNEFEEFCGSKNLLVLNKENNYLKEVETKKCVNLVQESPQYNEENMYVTLQQQYLPTAGTINN